MLPPALDPPPPSGPLPARSISPERLARRRERQRTKSMSKPRGNNTGRSGADGPRTPSISSRSKKRSALDRLRRRGKSRDGSSSSSSNDSSDSSRSATSAGRRSIRSTGARSNASSISWLNWRFWRGDSSSDSDSDSDHERQDAIDLAARAPSFTLIVPNLSGSAADALDLGGRISAFQQISQHDSPPVVPLSSDQAASANYQLFESPSLELALAQLGQFWQDRSHPEALAGDLGVTSSAPDAGIRGKPTTALASDWLDSRAEPYDGPAWWLDVMCPTPHDMRMIRKVSHSLSRAFV